MGKAHAGTAAGATAGQYAKQLANLSGPSRKLYFGQLKEALTQGTVKAKVPLIQQMVEQGLSQGSTAQKLASEEIGKLGTAARSTFGQETQAGIRATAERGIAAIPSEVISQTAMQAPTSTMGAMQAAQTFLGQASIGQSQANQARAANTATTIGAAGAGVAAAVAIAVAI
jgi:hypothetical protein